MHEYRFPKMYRLRKEKEIENLLKHGRRLIGKRLKIFVLENTLGHPRIAISVSARVGKAVKRNRWKRLIREVFRLNKQSIGNFDMLVIPLISPNELKMGDIQEEFLSLLKGGR